MIPVIYLLDQIPFKNYNVYVSDSSNLFDKASIKENQKKDWSDEHGYDIDLQSRYHNSKTITIDCFITANSLKVCIEKYNNFFNALDQKGSRRLSVIAGDLRMEYQVFRQDTAENKLIYDDSNAAGTFKLKLIENIPVKRILQSTQRITTINLKSKKVLVINWGDGTEEYTSPNKEVYSHRYTNSEIYFPMILGDLDSITLFNTNADVLWNRF
ncbi:hypothetical protein HX096_05795 [Empedobacter falsenii]|uniref:hypothetical protein n=1 Tax=Empedobacter falsenii TaxID=343874 RepID=UPI002576F30A|nr:hypothetical protein [Empedobacter falsenii]MDM1547372.1 hypothetical protein [Empedobacter falsenii]